MSLWDHYKGRHLKVWSFAERLGLIAWLHESMSRNSSPVEVLLLQKWRKKLSSFSPYVGQPEKAAIEKNAIKNLYPSPKTYIKCWDRKILALGMPPILLNTASNITHSAISSEDYSQVTTTFSTYCTVYFAAGDFNVNCANHDAKSVGHGTVLCAGYHVKECHVLELRSAGSYQGRSRRTRSIRTMQAYSRRSVRTMCMRRYIRPKTYLYMIGKVETTRSSFLLEEEMVFPQTEETLAFTIYFRS